MITMKNNFVKRLYKQSRMFKDFSKGFAKFFTTQRVILLVVFVVLAYVLYNYSSFKGSVMDGYDGGMSHPSLVQTNSIMSTPAPLISEPTAPIIGSSSTGGYNSLNTGNPSDLLPQDKNSQFSDFNMLNQGNITMPDLLDAGYLIGLDTIGQSLRNANLQERSDPIIPKSDVGPWNNSTIEPDLGRVPLELGVGLR
jgi:hypothetical protein